MRARIIYFFISLALIVSGINASQRGPAVISPGIEAGVAVVGQSCPTFSWTSVEWAKSYRVEVFLAVDNADFSYNELAAISSPVLSKEIQGQALSWTPSLDERLSNEVEYIWYVQAVDANGVGMWSEGKVFKVDIGLRFDRVEERVSERLREHGVSNDVIDEVLKDVKEALEQGLDEQSIGDITQNVIGIQGTEGSANTFYGLFAGFNNDNNAGINNTFIGVKSGFTNFNSDDNTFIGHEAGLSNTGYLNTFTGSGAGYTNSTGGDNTFMGYHAGYSNNTGNQNTFMGSLAGLSNTGGISNTFIGFDAGHNNITGDDNTFIGRSAGVLSTGDFSTFIGAYAGYTNSTGSENTFIGRRAGYNNDTGNRNIFVGSNVGYSNSTGSENTFMGYNVGYSNSTGYQNTFMGYASGNLNTTGYQNTFIGRRAGNTNSVGHWNTIIGNEAGYSNTGGNGNTFIGDNAGYNNGNGGFNTFIGKNSGRQNNSGQGNTAIGSYAGSGNQSGNNNIFLGKSAGFYETGSNKLYIDNSDTSTPLIYGELDNDILAINGKLGVGTQSPGYPMHLQKTGANAAFIADRTDGAINYINATAGYGNFGTVNNYPLRMVVNAVWRMRLDSDNSLTMANGATCTAGGVWTDASSRELKENIQSLTTEEAIDALNGLNPVKYNYKTDKQEGCVGFIAEEVPKLVASKDRKGMSPMDVVAVLTKVVQEQQKLAEKQQKTIDELQKKIDELERKSK